MYNRQIQEFEKHAVEIDNFKVRILVAEKKLSTINVHVDDSIEVDYSKSLNDIKELETRIVLANKYVKMCFKQKELEKKKILVEKSIVKLTNLHRFQQLAVEVEYALIQNTLESINVSMNDILTTVFDDPIKVTLSLYKQLKSDKNKIKPGLNLSIEYKGSISDNINQLSGGEGDRISFSLIVALVKLSGSPLLLLDECLSSLDGEIRESCLDSLRVSLGNMKTVLCISHQDTEGNYDSVIYV